MSNEKLVQATKEVLKQMGVEIKTTQVYEMYSKLLGEKNWNIAKSKNTDFSKIIYQNESLENLVININNLDSSRIISEINKRIGHKVTELDLNPWDTTHIIEWKRTSLNSDSEIEIEDVKVMVMFCKEKSINLPNTDFKISQPNAVTGKHISRIKKAMDKNECTHGIIYTSSEGLPGSLYKIASQLDIEIVDFEDMLNLARRVDKNKI